MKTSAFFLGVFALAAIGCEKIPDSGAKKASFADPPFSVRVKQRSTTPLPGTGEALRLTIGDITRGQVTASIAAKDGTAVLAPVSLTKTGTARFKYDGREYDLRLTKLSNALIGEDFASFFIADPASAIVPEDTKIDKLLTAVEKAEGAIFIRDGVEYSPKDASLHLRNKWLLHEVETARKFIDDHASRSSTDGSLYQIRLPNGKTVPVGDYLRERLEEIERAR